MKFPLETLSELRYLKPGEEMDGLTLMEIRDVDQRRWVMRKSMVFQSDGHFYLAKYEQGLTEDQDMSTEEEFDCYDDEVECVEVFPYEHVETRYRTNG